MQQIINGAVNRAVFLLFFLSFFIPANSHANGDDIIKCKSLDTREFGLIDDGNIGAPWSEAQLIDKYGQPCQIINLGEVFVIKVVRKITKWIRKPVSKAKLTSEKLP